MSGKDKGKGEAPHYPPYIEGPDPGWADVQPPTWTARTTPERKLYDLTQPINVGELVQYVLDNAHEGTAGIVSKNARAHCLLYDYIAAKIGVELGHGPYDGGQDLRTRFLTEVAGQPKNGPDILHNNASAMLDAADEAAKSAIDNRQERPRGRVA